MTMLHRQRFLVLSDPARAARVLQRHTLDDAVTRDTLLAEALLRLDDTARAAQAALRAVHHAGREQPISAVRLLPAVTVLADITCCTGAADAARSCTDLKLLARRFGDAPRQVLAVALRAVTVYQHSSCRHGRRLLQRLLTRPRPADGDDGGAAARMLSDALAMMTAACTAVQTGDQDLTRDDVADRCARNTTAVMPTGSTGPLVPVPGGLAQPNLTTPDPQYLTGRVQRHPGTHLCGAGISGHPLSPAVQPGGAGAR